MIATGEVDSKNFTVVAAGELAYVGARRGVADARSRSGCWFSTRSRLSESDPPLALELSLISGEKISWVKERHSG